MKFTAVAVPIILFLSEEKQEIREDECGFISLWIKLQQLIPLFNE
jgi:hypothetical protein